MAPPPPHADPRPADASEQAAEDSDGLGAAARVGGATDLIHAITSHVAEGDLLCWALACPGFLAAARQIRPGLWSDEGRITARVGFSPDRLRWIVAGHVAWVVEGSCWADTELQAAEEAIVESAVGRATERRRQRLELQQVDRAREVTGGAVIEAVVAAMEAHGGSAAVQEQGCRALGNLACDSPANQARAAKAGAIEAVVTAMWAHGGSSVVQENACFALDNLAAGCLANQARAAEAGAIEAVVAAMEEHGGSDEVQQWACFALGHLACNSPANKTRAAEAGAIEAVVAAMEAHGGSDAVQEDACCALGNLALDSPANRARAAEAGAMEAVVAAMETHEGSALVQAAGQYTLHVLQQHHD